MRQVGQLPRIIAWCTVNKTLNFNIVTFVWHNLKISHRGYYNIVLEKILRTEFVRVFDVIHRLVEPQAGNLRCYTLQNNYPSNRRLSADRIVPQITSEPVLGVDDIIGVTFSDIMSISLPVTHSRLVQKLQGCWKVLSPNRKETSYSDRRFWVSYILFMIIIGGILLLFIYITSIIKRNILTIKENISGSRSG